MGEEDSEYIASFWRLLMNIDLVQKKLNSQETARESSGTGRKPPEDARET